jgi:hypothetical protein
VIKRKQFEEFKNEFEDFCACGEFYGDICESDVKFVVDYCSELLNPWKDASKELPEYEKPVLCKSKKHEGYFSCIRHKSFLTLTSVDPSSRDMSDASHWMYIPEVNNE